MKFGDIYLHFKQNEYVFSCIALPLSEYKGSKSDLRPINLAYDAHSEKGKEPKRVQLYDYEGITFIGRDTPHVVYQDEKVWVREVDDFFAHTEKDGKWVKRFTKIEKSRRKQ